MHIVHPETASNPVAPITRSGLGTAHGKAILIGEHAAVYGAPAMAIPVLDAVANAELRLGGESKLDTALYRGPIEGAPTGLGPVIVACHSALERLGYPTHKTALKVTSNIPMRRGLGSSATVAAAVVDAVVATTGIELDTWTRWEIVQEAEKIAHGTPSGIDAATVLADGPILYQRGTSQDVPMGGEGFSFVLADTGEPSSTATAVARVRQHRERRPRFVDGVINQLATLTGTAVQACESGSVTGVGDAMNEAHQLLSRVGVSCQSLDQLVRAARDAGAAGAKLTGGGMGGCVITLAQPGQTSELEAALVRAGAKRTWVSAMKASA